MLRFSIILNSSVTFLIILINFGFKIYLTREFSQENLVVYYTITDIFSILTRVFIGYKDALTTIFNSTKHKLKILKTWTVFFIWAIGISSFLVIPLIYNYYLINKIDGLDIGWFYISLLFLSINLTSYYGYIFLVTKHYKLISKIDIVRTISFIVMILFLYLGIGFNSDYKTLIYASIASNFLILGYLIYKQKIYLKQYNFCRFFGIKFGRFQDNTNKKFIELTIMASLNYFIYGLLLFAPIWAMLNYSSTNELANFQVVARSIYFALISVFSWPLGRFMFPEFSSLIAKKEYKTLENIRKKFIKFLILFGIVVIIMCWLLSKYVISYLFPIEYIESYKMINILIVILPFVMYQNFSESVIKAIGDYKLNLIIKSTGIISFIISFGILNYYFKLNNSAIYSFGIGMLFIFLVSLYSERKIINKWTKI